MAGKLLKPQSIQDIHRKVYVKWYRIRDIKTNIDYLVLDTIQVSLSQEPLYVSAVCCDDGTMTTLHAAKSQYALLTSAGEGLMYRRYKKDALIRETLERYQLGKSIDFSELPSNIEISGG